MGRTGSSGSSVRGSGVISPASGRDTGSGGRSEAAIACSTAVAVEAGGERPSNRGPTVGAGGYAVGWAVGGRGRGADGVETAGEATGVFSAGSGGAAASSRMAIGSETSSAATGVEGAGGTTTDGGAVVGLATSGVAAGADAAPGAVAERGAACPGAASRGGAGGSSNRTVAKDPISVPIRGGRSPVATSMAVPTGVCQTSTSITLPKKAAPEYSKSAARAREPNIRLLQHTSIGSLP